MTARRSYPWTADDDAAVLTHNVPDRVTAAQIGRSVSAVRMRRRRLRLDMAAPAVTPQEIIDNLRGAGMTVKHLARVMGVSEHAIGAWCRGENEPAPYAMRRLVDLHSHLVSWEQVA